MFSVCYLLTQRMDRIRDFVMIVRYINVHLIIIISSVLLGNQEKKVLPFVVPHVTCICLVFSSVYQCEWRCIALLC